MVLTIGCVTITAFIRSKMKSSIVILDGITVVVMCGCFFVSGFMVRRSGSGMVGGGGFVDWVNWWDRVYRVDGVDGVHRVDRVSNRVIGQGQSGDRKN